MADTREGQVGVGAIVSSLREEAGYSFGLCSSSRLLAAAKESRLLPLFLFRAVKPVTQ